MAPALVSLSSKLLAKLSVSPAIENKQGIYKQTRGYIVHLKKQPMKHH